MNERWSVNGIGEYGGEHECNHSSGCHNAAEWEIKLIDRHGCLGLRRACDDHVEDMYGYHPVEDDHSYRVVGHYGGRWDQTEWMKTLPEAEQAYRKLKRGNWMQIAIERTDGKRKASLEGDEWVGDRQ